MKKAHAIAGASAALIQTGLVAAMVPACSIDAACTGETGCADAAVAADGGVDSE